MANIVVVGAQWGDEAKGKIVDYLAPHVEMVVRYGGGNNAGHTVKVGDETYKFHLVPSGILNPHMHCVLADGAVIDPASLVAEIRGLHERGVDTSRLHISLAAHIVLPYHRLIDRLEEERRGSRFIGTTGRGIGPAYADKAARVGLRMDEFVDPSRFADRLAGQVEDKNRIIAALYGADPLDGPAIAAEYAAYADFLRPMVRDTSELVHAAAAGGRGILFEGAQGSLLDIDAGTYPYVTSSHPIAGGACIGTGIGPTMIDSVVGVAKVYSTRVGEGVFPTELLDATGDLIRERGHEYGVTTGRPRRCGWLDTPVLRYSVRLNGIECLSIGHLDVLTGFERVNICTGYTDGDTPVPEFPRDIAQARRLKPVYESFEGWQECLDDVRSFDALPRQARVLLARLEELATVPIAAVSVGPAREQTILVGGLLEEITSRRRPRAAA